MTNPFPKLTLPDRIRTVLFFDLDGTLMINPFGKVVFPTVVGQLSAATGLTTQALMAEVLAEYQRRVANPHADNYPWTMDWDDIMQTVAKAHGQMLPPGIAEELAIRHAAPPDTATLDNAVAVLRALREPGHRWLVVASMGLAKYQNPVLRGLQLYECFDDFLMPDLTGYLKTDRRFYANYLRYAEQAGNQRKFISTGDNYPHDVVIPKSLGFYSVLRVPAPGLQQYSPFERTPHLMAHREMIQHYPDDPANVTAHPDAVIVSLAELPDVVLRLEQRA